MSGDDPFALLSSDTSNSTFVEVGVAAPLDLSGLFPAGHPRVLAFGRYTENISKGVPNQSAFGVKIDTHAVPIIGDTRLSLGGAWQRWQRDARSVRGVSSVHSELAWTLRPDLAVKGRVTGSFLDVRTRQPDRSAIQVQVSANYSASLGRNYILLLRRSENFSSEAYRRRSLQLASLKGRWAFPEGRLTSYLGISGAFIQSDYDAPDPRWNAVRIDRQVTAQLEYGRQLDASNDLKLIVATRNRNSSIPSLRRRSGRLELALTHRF